MTTPPESATAKASTSDAEIPEIRLAKGRSGRLRRGHPWVFSNEIEMDDAARALPPGGIVALIDAGDERLGLATFNPHTLIAARLLTRDSAAQINTTFIETRLRRALAIRETLYEAPWYRLVHAEADGLPGLVMDRFNDILVAQPNTAGVAALWPHIASALETVLSPRAIVLRGDSPSRTLEGLDETVAVVAGTMAGTIPVQDGPLCFAIDPLRGQKTGWYFDQAANRAFAARLAPGRRVLDVYCHTGGFGLRAAHAGAESAHLVDSAGPALEVAEEAARANGLETRVTITRGEAFRTLAELDQSGERYGLVIADPPAFAKSRKDAKKALRAYRKLARAAARLTEEDGFVMLSSCSHHTAPDDFREAVSRGLRDAGREARLIRSAGAGPDHPVHPGLPESAYLKCLAFALD